MEENETVQKALKRLTVEEENSRVMRYRIAFQQSLQQTILPKEQWTKPEDVCYYRESFFFPGDQANACLYLHL